MVPVEGVAMNAVVGASDEEIELAGEFDRGGPDAARPSPGTSDQPLQETPVKTL
jgi:hypothetical protein